MFKAINWIKENFWWLLVAVFIIGSIASCGARYDELLTKENQLEESEREVEELKEKVDNYSTRITDANSKIEESNDRIDTAKRAVENKEDYHSLVEAIESLDEIETIDES